MSLIIYFLRHGETTANQTGGYCGTLDPESTPVGYQMAEDFADAYKSLAWTAIFSSPLHRAVATAEPLCAAAGIRMQLKEGLREIAYGHWEERTYHATGQISGGATDEAMNLSFSGTIEGTISIALNGKSHSVSVTAAEAGIKSVSISLTRS